jgi:putative ABC transport system substrate-binding protein
MDRRRFVAGVLGLLAVPPAAHAQPAGRPYRVGWLDANPSWWGGWRTTLVTELKQRGWVAGRNLLLDWRQPGGTDFERDLDRLPELAAQLVRGSPDVLVAWGNLATQAVIAATRAIPIVFAAVDDPVGSGFVTNLARPGGNVTGVSSMTSDLPDEHLKLLVELLPGLSRVDALRDPGEPGAAAHLRPVPGGRAGAGASSLVSRGPGGQRSRPGLRGHAP